MDPDPETESPSMLTGDSGMGVVLNLLAGRGDALTVKSQAMRPLRAPLILVGAILVASIFSGNLPAQILGAILVTGALAFWARTYWHWLKNDPDRLGTETFVLQQQIVKVAAKDPAVVGQLASTMVLTTDPHPPKLQRKLKAGKKGGA